MTRGRRLVWVAMALLLGLTLAGGAEAKGHVEVVAGDAFDELPADAAFDEGFLGGIVAQMSWCTDSIDGQICGWPPP
jgi:hypothetical protein